MRWPSFSEIVAGVAAGAGRHGSSSAATSVGGSLDELGLA